MRDNQHSVFCRKKKKKENTDFILISESNGTSVCERMRNNVAVFNQLKIRGIITPKVYVELGGNL